MKRSMIKFLTVIMCFVCAVSGAVVNADAEEIHYAYEFYSLPDEQFAKVEEYLAADDIAGLYDYLRSDEVYGCQNGWLEYFTSHYTGEYILPGIHPLGEDNLSIVLSYYVYFDYEVDENGQGAPIADVPLYGDTNQDGKISILDVIALNKMASGITTATNPDHAELADVDGSYVIDFTDVTYLMQYLVDEIAILPAMNY